MPRFKLWSPGTKRKHFNASQNIQVPLFKIKVNDSQALRGQGAFTYTTDVKLYNF